MQASFRGFCAREELHRARQRRIKGDRKEAAFLLSSRLLTDFITEESRPEFIAHLRKWHENHKQGDGERREHLREKLEDKKEAHAERRDERREDAREAKAESDDPWDKLEEARRKVREQQKENGATKEHAEAARDLRKLRGLKGGKK